MSSINYWKNEWDESSKTDDLFGNPINDYGIIGGEVTNETDLRWLISGASNSNANDFALLPPRMNSDEFGWVKQRLKGDVDAVWPAGMKLKNGKTGVVVQYGAFKISDPDNANIVEEDGVFVIYDFKTYFAENNLPQGWKLPDIWDPRK